MVIVSNGSRSHAEPDFIVRHDGSVTLLNPKTGAAKVWCGIYLPQDATRWGSAYVVEPRHLSNILTGIVDAGLAVQL